MKRTKPHFLAVITLIIKTEAYNLVSTVMNYESWCEYMNTWTLWLCTDLHRIPLKYRDDTLMNLLRRNRKTVLVTIFTLWTKHVTFPNRGFLVGDKRRHFWSDLMFDINEWKVDTHKPNYIIGCWSFCWSNIRIDTSGSLFLYTDNCHRFI